MVKLEACIRHWKGVLTDSGSLLSPGTRAIVQATINHLEELKSMKESKRT